MKILTAGAHRPGPREHPDSSARSDDLPGGAETVGGGVEPVDAKVERLVDGLDRLPSA